MPKRRQAMLPMMVRVEDVVPDRDRVQLKLVVEGETATVWVRLEFAAALRHAYYCVSTSGLEVAEHAGEGRAASRKSMVRSIELASCDDPRRSRRAWRTITRILCDYYSPRVICERCGVTPETFRHWLGGQLEPPEKHRTEIMRWALEWLEACDAVEEDHAEAYIWRPAESPFLETNGRKL